MYIKRIQSIEYPEVKRYYLPYQIFSNCPQCNYYHKCDLQTEPLHNPKPNSKEEIYFVCNENKCEDFDWTETVIFDVIIKYIKPEIKSKSNSTQTELKEFDIVSELVQDKQLLKKEIEDAKFELLMRKNYITSLENILNFH